MTLRCSFHGRLILVTGKWQLFEDGGGTILQGFVKGKWVEVVWESGGRLLKSSQEVQGPHRQFLATWTR